MFFIISVLFFLYYSGSSALNGVHPNYKKNDQWLYKKSKVAMVGTILIISQQDTPLSSNGSFIFFCSKQNCKLAS